METKPDSSPAPGRKRLLRIAAVVLGVFAVPIALELSLRLILGPPELPVPVGLVTPDRGLGYRMTPNFSARFTSREFKTDIRTNSAGFRDDEWTEAAVPSNSLGRILALGDSYAFGHGVEHGENFLTLAESAADAGPIEIFNAAVPGWGPVQQVRLLEELLAERDAELAVIFFFIGNDFADAARPEGSMVPYRGILLTEAQYRERGAFTPLKVFARKHIKLYETTRDATRGLFFGREERLKHRRAEIAVCRIEPEPMIESSGQAAAVREKLGSFVRICRREGTAPALVLIPSRFQASAGFRRDLLEALGLDPADYDVAYPNRMLLAMAAELSIPVLDLLPIIAEKGIDPDALYFERNGHFNPHGHSWVAGPVRRFLERLLAETPAPPPNE